MRCFSLLAVVALLAACSEQQGSVQESIDVVLVGGSVINGLDEQPIVTDVGIEGDRIVAIGNLEGHPRKGITLGMRQILGSQRIRLYCLQGVVSLSTVRRTVRLL